MRAKKMVLSILLIVLSLFLGYTLGKLDFFGFLDNRKQLHFTLLLSSLLLWYLIAIVLFLLDFSDKKNILLVCAGAAVLFGCSFLLTHISVLIPLLSTVFFFLFLFYTYETTLKRSRLFIKFVPSEILTPVIKHGFLFLLTIFALLSFFQAKNRQLTRTIITPQALQIISKPLVYILNKQLGAQLQLQLGDKFKEAIGTTDREKIVHFVLDETLEGMTEGKTRQLFGINADNIPVQKTIVYPNGEIDLTPVMDAVLPELSRVLNDRIANFGILLGVAIAILVLLLIQPLLGIFQFIISAINAVLFYILFKTNFLRKEKESVEREVTRL